MSANSDASSGPPLCHCGVPAVLRDSTNANFHGCVNQEVIFEIYLSFVFLLWLVICDNYFIFNLSCRNLVIVIFLIGLSPKCALMEKDWWRG
jgi:hypothetical protein